MTTPKVKTLYRSGSRFYIHPEDPDRKVPGVTSVLGMLPKPFLKPWAAKEVATSAVAMSKLTDAEWDSGVRSELELMAHRDPEGAIDYLKRSPDRNTKAAADQGSNAHGIFETLLLGQKLGPIVPSLEPFARQYEDLLNKLQPTALRTEDTVWSDTHAYAGSFDALVEIQGDRAWVDNKTTRSGVYPEVALQLAAYANADYLLDTESGEQLVHPKADFGLVFHVRPDAWAVYEVPIGDDVFEYFLHLRAIFEWDRIARSVIGRPALKGDAFAIGGE